MAHRWLVVGGILLTRAGIGPADFGCGEALQQVLVDLGIVWSSGGGGGS